MKIWYQSFVDPTAQVGYFRHLEAALQAMAGPSAGSDVHYDVHGMAPPDLELHRITEFRCAAQVIRNAVSAERQGYDGLAIGHFQDGGLYEARAAVDIPVVGLGEASMLYACTLGRRIALVTINPVFIPFHEEQIVRYGLQQRIVEVRALTTDPLELDRAFTDQAAFDRIVGQFQDIVRPLAASGVEVVIPAGGLPMLLLSRLKHFTVGHTVVLSGLAVLTAMTEMAVRLRRFDGTGASRAATFAKPSAKALQEFLDSGPGGGQP